MSARRVRALVKDFIRRMGRPPYHTRWEGIRGYYRSERRRLKKDHVRQRSATPARALAAIMDRVAARDRRRRGRRREAA